MTTKFQVGIPWLAVISRIDGHMSCMRQWAEAKDYVRASHYRIMVESLIELLEIDLCGSVGGFDAGQDIKHRTLKGRVKWLKMKARKR